MRPRPASVPARIRALPPSLSVPAEPPAPSVRVGAFSVRPGKPGKLWLHSRLSGEVMETDEAALESHLERYWHRHF